MSLYREYYNKKKINEFHQNADLTIAFKAHIVKVINKKMECI